MNHKEEFLSKNQQIIFDFIEKAKEPLKAYSILFNVQKKGIKAPLQVYRALDKLVEIGKIHKVESRNAFIACKSSSCEISQATAFSICNKCENVSEINNPIQMVVYSVIGGLLSVIVGLFASLELNSPSGPSIITAALVLFIFSLTKINKFTRLKN